MTLGNEPGLVVGTGDFVYNVVRPWGELPAGWSLGLVSHVATDSRDRVYLYQRKDPPVLVFDRDGHFLTAWGSQRLRDAHGIFVDRDDHVYVCNRDEHEVLKLTAEGKIVLVLGQRGRPALQAPFNHPADVAVSPTGEIYVADGYGNSAVHRFSPEGQHLGSWGTPGAGRGQLTTPHGIWADGDRVLVADRENNRVQLFSPEGDFYGEWARSLPPDGHLRGRHGDGLRHRPDTSHHHVLPGRQAAGAGPAGYRGRPRRLGRLARQPVPGRGRTQSGDQAGSPIGVGSEARTRRASGPAARRPGELLSRAVRDAPSDELVRPRRDGLPQACVSWLPLPLEAFSGASASLRLVATPSHCVGATVPCEGLGRGARDALAGGGDCHLGPDESARDSTALTSSRSRSRAPVKISIQW